MIDPLKVLVVIPALDSRIEAGCALGLVAAMSEHLYGGIQVLGGVSNIALCRNQIAAKFMAAKNFDWLVCIDSDIIFSPRDFKLLMNYPELPPHTDEEAANISQNSEDNPPEVTVNEHGQALIVCAEYSRKVESGEPARFGFGFVRLHRSVFEIMKNAKDDEGTPRVGQFTDRGVLVDHFFADGPGFAGHWFGEDTGFFHVAKLCGITPRIEQRTRLMHVGRRVYPYIPGTAAHARIPEFLKLGGGVTVDDLIKDTKD